MDIYVALHDHPDPEGKGSFVVGAFSAEDKAQAACQDDADSSAASGTAVPLAWQDAEAPASDGTRYVVVLVTLDQVV